MTDKKKAKELASLLVGEDQNQEPLVEILMEMAQWKEQQMMKGSVPCKIEYKDKWHINLITDGKIMEEYTERMAFKCRDKGKLIIIKED